MFASTGDALNMMLGAGLGQSGDLQSTWRVCRPATICKVRRIEI
jgi:hypothetical protein